MVLENSPVKFAGDITKSVFSIDKISIAALLVMVQLFVFLSAPQLWDSYEMQEMVKTYALMVAFSFAVLDRSSSLFQISIWDGIIQYVVSFAMGLVIFDQLGIGSGSGVGSFQSLTLLIIAEVFVVALSEEMMFRGGLPSALVASKFTLPQALLLSNIGFAVFHIWAYNWDLSQLFAAFCFGLLMSYFWYGGKFDADSKSTWPLVACGLHGAWNVVIIGGPF